MTTGEVDIELPAARMRLTAEQAQFEALEPHRTIGLNRTPVRSGDSK